jgi:hypothetical protein
VTYYSTLLRLIEINTLDVNTLSCISLLDFSEVPAPSRYIKGILAILLDVVRYRGRREHVHELCKYIFPECSFLRDSMNRKNIWLFHEHSELHMKEFC